MITKEQLTEFSLKTVESLNNLNTIATPNRDNSDLIHWSSLIHNNCPRYYSLVSLFPEECPSKVNSSSTKITFEIGRHVEDTERAKLISIYKKGVLGKWACNCSKTEKRSIDQPVEKCTHCGNPLNVYGEFKLNLDKFNVTGSPDFLLCRNNTIIVFEIKSKADALFKDVRDREEADPSHKIQAGAYVHFLNEYKQQFDFLKDYKVSPYYLIYYVNKKNVPFKNPYYIYVGDANDGIVKEGIKNGVKLALNIKANKANNILPEKKCESFKEGKRIQCPAVNKCFQI